MTNAYRIQGRLTFKEYLLQIAERQLNSLSEENRKLIGGIVTDWLQKYYSEEFEDDY